MSCLPQTKFGDCANPECGIKNTQVVKVGKYTYCLNCRNAQKTKVQIQKATVKNQVRGLYSKQSESGNYEDASRSSLILDIDYFYSRYLRLREADAFGNIKCFICGDSKAWSLSHVMHFIGRSCISLRFFEKNTKCGCYHCNINLNGNLEQYAIKLDQEQEGLSEMLKEQSRQVEKPTLDELKMLLSEYKMKYKLVENKFK